MKRGTAAKVILGKDTLMDVPAGIVHGTDVILGGKAGLLNDFGGLVLSNNLMIGKKVSRGTITTVTVRGQSPLVLPDAISGSLQAVKAFGGTEQRSLPQGYQQLVSLTTDSASYFDTDYVINSLDVDVTTDAAMALLSSGPNMIWGFMGTSSNLPRWGVGSYQSNWMYGANATQSTSAIDTDTSRHTSVGSMFYAEGVPMYGLTVDGVAAPSLSLSNVELMTNNTLSAFIGARNNRGTAGNFNPSTFYSFKIEKAGELVVNMVPAKRLSDNVVGFYDTVRDRFFTNAGTGTITAGDAAVPTPTAPLDIICNNGVLRVSPNYLDMSDENIVLGKYIDNSGVPTSGASNFYNSKYIPVVGGETYTWSTSSSINYFSVMEYNSSKTFTNRTLFSNAGTSGSITLRSDTAYVLIGSNISGATVTIDMLKAINWQFERGSTASTFMPFGKVYADGTVETINIHGKNLNGGGALDNKGYTSTGGTSTSTTFCGTLWKIKCKEGEKYTVSFGNFPDGISGVFVNTWKTDGTWNLRQAISISGAYTYTIPAGIGEVNFTLYKTGGITIASNSWLQVEKGETATDYEPYYDGGTATAEMLLKLVGAVDDQEILSGTVTRNVEVIVFNGTESFTTSTAYGEACLVYSASTIWGADASIVPLCTHFLGLPRASSGQPVNTCFFNDSGHFYFRLEDNTVATFKAWLEDQYAAGTPVMLLVATATPTTESVIGQTLQVQAGDNTLEITQASLTGLELEATYKSLVQLTIQEVEDANLNNNVEVTIS